MCYHGKMKELVNFISERFPLFIQRGRNSGLRLLGLVRSRMLNLVAWDGTSWKLVSLSRKGNSNQSTNLSLIL